MAVIGQTLLSINFIIIDWIISWDFQCTEFMYELTIKEHVQLTNGLIWFKHVQVTISVLRAEYVLLGDGFVCVLFNP